MKALIYCRVSSQRQVKEGNGLSSQEQRCRVHAVQKGYPVEAVFPDDGISGGLFERPAMKQLIQYIDNHTLEEYVIIFDDLSRFARDVKVHIQLRAEFSSRGVRLECLNFNFEESDESEMAELMLAVSNQYQRKSNRRQVIQKQKARLEKGYWAFFPPLGLSAVKDPIHGKLLKPVEPYASIIKTALENYAVGILNTQEDVQRFILNKYKEHGITKKLSLSGTQRILRQILYTGYVEYPKWSVERRKGHHEGIITIETYEKVQQRIRSKGKKWTRHDYSSDFPLRTHIICVSCNKPLTASWNTGRHGRRYPNYFCINKYCKYKYKVIGRKSMEDQFEALLYKVRLDNTILDVAKLVLTEAWNLKKNSYEEIRQLYLNRKVELEAKVSSLLERITKASSEDLIKVYENEIEKYSQEIRSIDMELISNPYNDERFGTATEKLFSLLKNPIDMWQSENVNDKKAVLYAYFNGKVEYDYKNGFGTASLAYPVKLIGNLATSKNTGVEMAGNEPASKNHIQKHLQA